MMRSLAIVALAALTAFPAVAQDPGNRFVERDGRRLVLIKVDGLSPIMMDALVFPDDPEKMGRMPDPAGFRNAIEQFKKETGQDEVVPNLKRYFYDLGVRAENLVSATVTLSSVSWGVIYTGQPSVVKRHMVFSRQNGTIRSNLDGLRDTYNMVVRHARKTGPVWELDQAGVSLFTDLFHPERIYQTPWMYYRQTPQDFLTDLGMYYLKGDAGSAWGVAKTHMARLVDDMNFPEWEEQFVGHHLARKVLEKDFTGEERYDLISTFFTIDHQFHIDPNPLNVVHRMARLDRRIGYILKAVEQSQRRDKTLVAVISDHGSEYATDGINVSLPITRTFRTRQFGGHTLMTMLAELSRHSLLSFVQGFDFPRLYESSNSPYNKGKGGAGGYTTAFIDNFGNARAEVHLRNNDLNRLHLLLKRRLKKMNNDQRSMMRIHLTGTLTSIEKWLAPELALYRDYFEGARAWTPYLLSHRDSYWREAGMRLRGEGKADAPKLLRLRRLLELCQADDPVAWLDEKKYSIPGLLPKKYFGPRNTLFQLSHYTLGLDDDLEWIEETVNNRGEPVPMNYFDVISNFEVPNPPWSYERNPFALILANAPLAETTRALRERGWLGDDAELDLALWLKSTSRKTTEGGQALVLRTTDGRIRYLPVSNLVEDAAGRITFDPAGDRDPLGLYSDPAFNAPDGLPAYLWLRSAHTYAEWVEATHATRYTIAPLVFLDIGGHNSTKPMDNPEFLRTLTGFPNEAVRERYLRGLRWKYQAQQPDLLLWSSYLWNFSSKGFTAGGSHGGLPPHVAKTSLLLWGGDSYGLPAGGKITRPSTTLDLVPTFARFLGLLDDDGNLLRQAGSYRHRPLLRPPGRVMPVEGPTVESESVAVDIGEAAKKEGETIEASDAAAAKEAKEAKEKPDQPI